MFKLGTRK